MYNFKDQLTTELITIDNTECTVNAAFNISDDRFREIMNTLQDKASSTTNKECASEYMSRALYSCNPKSILEVFVIGQAIGAALNMD
tara:strand:+ start:767 stop:1027 length:261 start_codon:yes stop_codon:yes gene_type:complete